MGDLPKWARAQRRTRKDVGLENALPKWWGLKGTLKKRWGLKGVLKKKEVGLENALPKWFGWWINNLLKC
jgi:hypothetical protein